MDDDVIERADLYAENGDGSEPSEIDLEEMFEFPVWEW